MGDDAGLCTIGATAGAGSAFGKRHVRQSGRDHHDPGFTRVTGRGLEPMLVPPPAVHRASTVMEGDRIALYFSLEDRMLRRALVARYGK